MKIMKGLILAEAIVTISIIITCSIIAGSIFTTAVTTTMLSKDFLIASGLVIEGADAVRNIVDTNKMILQTDKTCWLTTDPQNINLDNLSCFPTALNGNYIVGEKDENSQKKGKWKLSSSSVDDLDLEKNPTAAKLYLLYLDNLTGRYVTSSNNSVLSKFYRSVKFLDISADYTYAIFEVKVSWYEGAKAWSTSTVSKIFNK